MASSSLPPATYSYGGLGAEPTQYQFGITAAPPTGPSHAAPATSRTGHSDDLAKQPLLGPGPDAALVPTRLKRTQKLALAGTVVGALAFAVAFVALLLLLLHVNQPVNKLGNQVVTSDNLKPSAVQDWHIALNAVESSHLAPGAVDSVALGLEAVHSIHIEEGVLLVQPFLDGAFMDSSMVNSVDLLNSFVYNTTLWQNVMLDAQFSTRRCRTARWSPASST